MQHSPASDPDPAAELARETEAVLAEARATAAEELARAQRDADEFRARAERDGYAEGQARAEAELQAKLTEFEALVAALQARQEDFFARIEGEVVAISLEIARKVVDHEVEAHPELVVDQAKRCLRRLKQREQIVVRVNAADLETLRAAKESLLAYYDGVQRLDIMDDLRVKPGGCVVESPAGILDARLDRQLAEVERTLTEAVKSGNRA